MDKFIVSARKYRPQDFSTVVGQSHITTTLKNAIRNKQLAHAFLFCGPRGVGKTTCARILAKTINCENVTPEGEASIAEVPNVLAETLNAHLAGFSKTEWQALSSYLERMVVNGDALREADELEPQERP